MTRSTFEKGRWRRQSKSPTVPNWRKVYKGRMPDVRKMSAHSCHRLGPRTGRSKQLFGFDLGVSAVSRHADLRNPRKRENCVRSEHGTVGSMA